MSTLSEAVPGESRPAGGQPGLLPPLLTEAESPFDLEQQWQDLMSIMEMQVSSWGGRSMLHHWAVVLWVLSQPVR